MLIVLGTRNPKKLEEIAQILGDLQTEGLEFADLTRFPQAPEVAEDGSMFEANARKKASELAMALSQWVLGEDSGLVVPALHGRPGVQSARYSGKHGDDAANNAKLLAELSPLPEDHRAAYYVCSLALADPQGQIQSVVQGHCHGMITRELRGSGGFGYDPLFLIDSLGKTTAELEPDEKHQISHRGKALRRLRELMERSKLI